MGNVLATVTAAMRDGPTEFVFGFLFQHAKYITELEETVEALQSAGRRLEARRIDLVGEIEIAAGQGLQLLEGVRVWRMEVIEMESQVGRLLDAKIVEMDRLFMYGYCSKNFRSTYNYGKEVSETLKKVKHILSSERFEVVARRGPPPEVEEGPTDTTVGLENMLEVTWKRLMEAGVGFLGLYGMGGVGKTTLLQEINNKFLEKRIDFDVVISVVVSQDIQIGRIQDEIGKRLGCHTWEWEFNKSKSEKAYDIRGILTRKRFVLLLDDIWQKVELKEVGIPIPSAENRSKVVFTTRSKKVCGRMGSNVEMEVKCLEPENAWKLFQQKVRPSTLESDPQIPELARIVCGKCKGLPLALKVIGETMACKETVQEWQHAIDVLDTYAAEYPEVEEEILRVLKFSYDDLKDKIVQQCFQYCALLPEDDKIDKTMLVDYWVCEGIINEGGRKKSMNKGYDVIGILVNACLLINLEYGVKVVMHDVVRQMAQWIASGFGKHKENFVVKTGGGLHHLPAVDDWNEVTRMSVGYNQIKEILIPPQCLNLQTLFLQHNKLENIAGAGFKSMPYLVVLDLSWNSYLKTLPEDVSELTALRYLGLAGTGLTELPMGLRQLIRLRHLDMDFMDHLQSISVISSLLSLETLKVYDSTALNLEVIKDMELLNNLIFLSVTIKKVDVLERLLSIPRLARCTRDLYLKGCNAGSGIGLVESICTLVINGCYISDIRVACRYTQYANPSNLLFRDLNSVSISYVNGLTDLTWLLFAPSLTTLQVKGPSHEMQEIISKDKAADIFSEQPNIIPFRKLSMIGLYSLVELTSIYWEPLPFLCLREIVVLQCPKLKKFPFNKDSSKGNQIRLVVDKEEQFVGVEWEDQDTRDRFLQSREVRP